MRFTRLKKHIEASLSISTLASVSTNGKTGNSTEAGPKNNAKRKISEKQKQPLSSKFGGDQIGNVEGELKIKTENAEIEVVTPSAPVKRQSRGKKIDVSAAFESDSSPTPGARVEHEVHSSDYEDSQAAGEEDDGIPGGFESEHEHLAKRRRLFPLKRKQSRPDFNRRLFPNNGPRSLPQSVLKEPISTSDAGSTSICAAQFISAYPNPPDSRYTNAATANLSFTDASAADIMPSIEYDASNDGSLEKLFDSVNANTGSLEEESEIQDNDSTKPANSAFLLQNTVPVASFTVLLHCFALGRLLTTIRSLHSFNGRRTRVTRVRCPVRRRRACLPALLSPRRRLWSKRKDRCSATWNKSDARKYSRRREKAL